MNSCEFVSICGSNEKEPRMDLARRSRNQILRWVRPLKYGEESDLRSVFFDAKTRRRKGSPRKQRYSVLCKESFQQLIGIEFGRFLAILCAFAPWRQENNSLRLSRSCFCQYLKSLSGAKKLIGCTTAHRFGAAENLLEAVSKLLPATLSNWVLKPVLTTSNS